MVSGAIMIVITAIMTGERHDSFSNQCFVENMKLHNTSMKHYQTTPYDKLLLQAKESMSTPMKLLWKLLLVDLDSSF